MSRIMAIVYARYNSERLPGKVLFDIGGISILGRCIQKLRGIPGVRVLLATSYALTDDPIYQWAVDNSVDVVRGELDNVAARTKICLEEFHCDAFYRINADSPFLQPTLLQTAREVYLRNPSIDVVSNVFVRSYPYGIAVELISSRTFLKFHHQFSGDHNEHITSFFYENSSRFNIEILKNNADLSKHRFVLDTPQDWIELQRLYHFDKRIFDYNIADLIQTKEKLHEEHLFDPSKGI